MPFPDPEFSTEESNGFQANGTRNGSDESKTSNIEEVLISSSPEIFRTDVKDFSVDVSKDLPTVSSFMTIVYDSMRTGELYAYIMELLGETMSKNEYLS